MIKPLTLDQSNTAGSGMNQARIALVGLVRAAEQVMRGGALEHRRRGRLELDVSGELD